MWLRKSLENCCGQSKIDDMINVMIAAISPSRDHSQDCFVPTYFSQAAQKVHEFFQRYWRDILVYSAIMIATYLASRHSPGLGRACASAGGFFWVLGNTSGKPIAKDFLEPVQEGDLCDFPDRGGAFEGRHKDIEEMFKILQWAPTERSPTLGWCLLHGPVGIGKSEAAKLLAHRLMRQGHQVFFLKKGHTLNHTESYDLINKKFEGVTPRPILVIDDAWSVIQAGPGSWGELTNTVTNPPNFNVLAITHTLQGVDPGILSRFGGEKTGRRFAWKPLPTKDVVTLIQRKSNITNLHDTIHILAKDEGNPPDLLRLAWQKIDEPLALKEMEH